MGNLMGVVVMGKRTKEFLIEGGRNEADVLLSTTFKVNTPKQAKTRFTNKYGAILVGYWFFSILDHQRQTVDAFEIGNKVVAPDDHVQVDLFNKESNKTVTPNPNDVEFDLMGAIDSASSCSKSLFELKKEQEKKLKERNKTVTPDKPLLVSEYGVMLLVRYQLRDKDGHLQHWTGHGRRPMWLENYIKEGGDLSAIRVNQGFEQDFDTKEVRRINKEHMLA